MARGMWDVGCEAWETGGESAEQSVYLCASGALCKHGSPGWPSVLTAGLCDQECQMMYF
jgi:hypothetical protein